MPNKYTIGAAFVFAVILLVLTAFQADAKETQHKLRVCVDRGCTIVQIKCKPSKTAQGQMYCWTYAKKWMLDMLEK